MPYAALNIRKGLTGMALKPVPIEGLSCDPKLNNKVVRKIRWFDLAALFAPESQQRCLIATHYNARFRSPNKNAAVRKVWEFSRMRLHRMLP